MAQNSANNPEPTPTQELVRRGPGKPFAKGDPRINKAGKPRGFGRYIREVTGESGEALFAIAWKIARGKLRAEDWVVTKMGEAVPVDKKPSIRERLDAVKFLAEHGFGKAPASLNVTGTIQHIAQHDLSRLSETELEQLDALVNRIELDVDEPGELIEGELVNAPEQG